MIKVRKIAKNTKILTLKFKKEKKKIFSYYTLTISQTPTFVRLLPVSPSLILNSFKADKQVLVLGFAQGGGE